MLFSKKQKQHPDDLLEKGRKRSNKPLKKIAAEHLSRAIGKGVDWLRVEGVDKDAITLSAAKELSNRVSLSSLLTFADIESDGIILTDDGDTLRCGFMLEYSTFSVAGVDAESRVEQIISQANVPGTMIQFGVLGNVEVMDYLDAWQAGREKNADSAVMSGLARARAEFFKGAVHAGENYGYSLVQERRVHPKRHVYLMTVMVPFTGDISDEQAWLRFGVGVQKLRGSLIGAFEGSQLKARPLDRAKTRHYLRLILNPQHVPEVLSEREDAGRNKLHSQASFLSSAHLVERDHRMGVTSDGTLLFEASSNPEDPRRKHMVCLTVDRYPEQSYLPRTSNLMGELARANECIPNPFWLYTNIVVQDTDAVAERMRFKQAMVARQLVSDSPAYRAFMSHLFEMRDEIQQLSATARQGHALVTAYRGINILTDAESAHEDAQAIASLWKVHGFSAKPERFITLPIYLASIPGMFTPDMDPVEVRAGLQRSSTMSTFHAATLTHMQGEWGGCNPNDAGLLLASRRAQLASINIMDGVSANYNFCVVAMSGAGKSFFAQEIVIDFLSKGGMAYIIDAGKSYFELVEQLGGTNLVFKVDDPLDLNPFAQIVTEKDLKEMLPLLKEVIRYMAWPQSAETVPDWQYALLDHAIEASWMEHRQNTTIPKVVEWLSKHSDPRAHDVADQLRPYSEGRLKDWFDGTGRKVDLKGRLVCLEMDELKSQGEFRDVVLTLVMQRIADVMYRDGNQSRPKLMLIDEAWDLLSSNQAGPFINRAFRTYRKYGGSAGVITQSFADFNVSQAAQAAYTNSSWLFMLQQKSESLEAAYRDGRLANDDYSKRLMSSVHTSQGNYSEVFVRNNELGSGIFRFIVDPYTYWLYTTKPSEKTMRSEALNAHLKANPGMSRTQAMSLALQELADKTFKERGMPTPREALKRMEMAWAA